MLCSVRRSAGGSRRRRRLAGRHVAAGGRRDRRLLHDEPLGYPGRRAGLLAKHGEPVRRDHLVAADRRDCRRAPGDGHHEAGRCCASRSSCSVQFAPSLCEIGAKSPQPIRLSQRRLREALILGRRPVQAVNAVHRLVERLGSEDDRERVGHAPKVQITQQSPNARLRCSQRSSHDRRAPPHVFLPRCKRGGACLQPCLLASCAQERRLGRIQLEQRRLLGSTQGCRLRPERGDGVSTSHRRRQAGAQHADREHRRERQEPSRSTVHRRWTVAHAARSNPSKIGDLQPF